MKRLINYLRRLTASLHRLVLLDPQQMSLLQYFKSKRASYAHPRDVVLVQSVEDIFYLGLFGQIVTSLREQHPIRVEQFVLRSLNVGEANSFWFFLKIRFFINVLHSHKWKRLYRSFCNGVAYTSTSFQPFNDLVDLYRAWVCWNKLDNKNALIDLVIDGVLVGDLINDSFLRFKPAATVYLSDTYLLILLWQAYRDVRRAKVYFARVKPKLYLTSYSTYIQHGIAVRVALLSGVRVFSFGNYQEFAKELTLLDWVHTKNPDNYSDEFSKLSFHEEKLAIADAALSARMAGIIDNATAYMKKSAYAESSDPVPNVYGAVVIFLHDFFDSPHIYRNMVFPDFWEWVCFTIDTLKKQNIHFFVKPHPNQIRLSGNVLAELKQRYSELLEIPSSISNKQLVEAGMACAVTVYGTVAHEMAYLGVPTIACAHHPHISFDFCKTAKSREEYAQFLEAYKDINIDKSELRQQSLAFYYMHNLNINEEERSLRDKLWREFFSVCNNNENHRNVVKVLNEISALPAYEKYILKWFAAIYGGKSIVGNHKIIQSSGTSLF